MLMLQNSRNSSKSIKRLNSIPKAGLLLVILFFSFHALAVTATKLVFSIAPSYAKTSTNFSVTVKAVDNSGAIDVTNVSSITLSKFSGTGIFSSVAGLTQSLVAGTHTWTDIQYTVAETAALQANSSVGLTSTSVSIVFTTQNVYYVNDALTNIDQYTTAAGNNSTALVNDNSHPWASLKTVFSLAGLANADYIYVDAGAYADQDMTFSKANLTINGAIDGTGNPITYFVNASNDHYFIQINQNNTKISNFNLSGYNNATTCGSCGACLTVNATGCVVTNVQITKSFNNSSAANYAIMVLANATVTFNNGGSYCNDKSSTAHQSGGMYLFGTGITATIENYVFNNNYTGNNGGNLLIDNYAGGGSYNASTTKVYIKNSRFLNMTGAVENRGVALQLAGGSVTISDCYFDGNNSHSAATINEGTIAITDKAAGFTARRSVFTNNTGANVRGVTICVNAASAAVVIDSCYFSGNSSTSATGNDIYIKSAASAVADYNIFASSAPNYAGVSPTHSGLYNASSPGPTLPGMSGSCATTVSITPLPIELITFVGECSNDQVVLMWKTASEKNNNKFFIEKTLDGVNYTTIGSVNGAGNSSNVNNYSFVDVEKYEGLAYYRLTQEDFDGARSSSNLIAVEHSCGEKDDAEIILYPNPSSSDFTLDMKLYKESEVSFEMFNSIGALVKNTSNQMYQLGIQTINIDSNDLMKGVYYIKVMVNKKEYFQKFVKL